MTPYLRRLRALLPLALILVAALTVAPATAAPVQTGSLSASSSEFSWQGGPLSGGSLVGEPCGTTHQCEDILLHVGDSGELEIEWQASSPGDQAWLFMELYKSDAEGNPEGDAIVGTGAVDNQGAVLAVVEPGDYIVRVGAFLSVAATYEATATLTPGSVDDGAEFGPEPPDASTFDWYKQAGAEWLQAYIEEPDGTVLHADILRPEGMPADQKTPVILSIGPYFNHTGQTGPAGPTQGTSYDPFATPGPSNRFADFILGADVIRKGYTWVQVDLRGFGGSSGCLDWGGPGEQADVVAAVEWAASQPWSTGKVGMYGKSYDGVTGLLGEILNPKGLAAVVAQEPVYDMYRYLYADGIRFHNSLATPALYDAIALTPGSVSDEPGYFIGSVDSTARPGCDALNWADQQDPNHDSPYWEARDLIAKASDGKTPLFLTQGFLENNTKPDGTWDFFNAVDAPKRAWFGMWDHVRGSDVNDENRLLMGRKGFNAEVLRFYDRWLKGAKPAVKDPTLAVQTNDGTWRAEQEWPPADSRAVEVPLSSGEYVDDVGTKASNDGLSLAGTPGVGVWTISPPLPYEAHMVGVPRLTLDVETSAPNANLAAAVYDIDEENRATLISRQGRLVPQSGSYTLDMYGNDWRILPGHRVGVMVSTAHSEWWLAAVPTHQTVSVANGSLELPFLTYTRPDHIDGKRAVRLEAYLANTPIELSEETIESSTDSSFPLPPEMVARPAAKGGKPRGGKGKVRRRFSARLATSDNGKRLVVRGRAPKGSRLKIRLVRRGETVAKKRKKTERRRWVARFRVERAGRYRAVVTGRKGDRKMRARTKAVRVSP
jgi:predicted acyl esterase